ncbi:CrcB family protein [Leucobacter sp. UT-8R-CII-1-4]|uniref:CrcB family protein n=1 Tax=Leucobacter sp. UT-8R-CII-1-4 TaxID=3040075 RepID=UPI0024A8D348|nr:CrcB family protein [Leucobacter sp. UT-8R-CII-1-4]MDI6022288.1 CrcB family protein [Leucobacter sp. UT-8R-CII-1-4]
MKQQQTPAYLRPSLIALVFVGGAAGVFTREMLMPVVPVVAGVPLAVFLANIVGAFLLGCLLERLAVSGDEPRRNQNMRLLLGTGFLGGFTTYSAIAQGVVLMLSDEAVWLAVTYPLVTIVLGALASWGGILCGVRTRGRGGSQPSGGGDDV